MWVASCVLLTFPSSAQTSRAGLVAREQEAKSRHLGVEGPSRTERFVVWAESSPLFGTTSGPYPWSRNIHPGTGVGVGAGYVQRGGRGARMNGVGGASLEGSWLVRFDARTPTMADGRLFFAVAGSHVRAENLAFRGLGPGSTRDASLHYDYRPTSLGASAVFHPARRLELSGGYERLSLDSRTSTPDPAAIAPGVGEELSYDVMRLGAGLDWRPSPDYATRGGSHHVSWSWYRESRDHPFAFRRVDYEGTQQVPFLREQFVLAGRVLATLTDAKSGEDVPVPLMPTLGGAETLRGFKTQRFTDRNRLLLTGEYRWRPSRYVDMAAFVDAGRVAARRGDLDLSNLETDWGLGARMHGPERTLFRAEVAKSREGWRGNLAGGKVF